jgi:hypothetical protein
MVRLDNVWLSIAEIRIDGGVFIIALLDDEAGARLDQALSNFEMEDCGAGAGDSCSCVKADFRALGCSDGSLFTGASLQHRVGDVEDEMGYPDGNVGTLAAKGDILGLAVNWDKTMATWYTVMTGEYGWHVQQPAQPIN